MSMNALAMPSSSEGTEKPLLMRRLMWLEISLEDLPATSA